MSKVLIRLRGLIACELDVQLRRKVGLSITNKILCFLIVIAMLTGILETEKIVTAGREPWFKAAELGFAMVFSIEYVLRVWTCVENPKYRTRFHYVFSPIAMLELAIVLASWLVALGSTGYLVRGSRLIRISLIAKLGRYSKALHNIRLAIRARKEELLISLCAAILLMLVSSMALYIVESDIQPEHFGSIPRAMWWSVVTLTTVGYGDVYPVTTIGRILAAITAISGIGLIALPTSILTSAFSEVIQKKKIADLKSDTLSKRK